MPRKALLVLSLIATVTAAVWYLRQDRRPEHYTGVVEGEERIIRSEVSGRVLEVRFGEGAIVPANTVVASISDNGITAKMQSKQQEIASIDADVRAQQEQVALLEATWERDVSARRAELEHAESAARLAERTLERERALVKSGASTNQLLDDVRARRDQAESMLVRARALLARTEAEQRRIPLARKRLESLASKRDLAEAQLRELEIERAKHEIRSPAATTVVQTQFLWPGELAQPGSAVLALLDPLDKYVQIYVPVSDIARLRLGQRAEIELDSAPQQRIPGEISFIADRANFTPEKIETRSDRMGQVYRVKVRVLDGVEQLRPGTEGNVYLAGEAEEPA
ncbi:MAG TPA: HlyD family efflux transporter periplasmic adaptor subunit [Terriglobales bacterium]|nr:HlyD family efflux transporter periplasmic adaptor subunit [Terriglobales bacterium]